MIVSKSWICSHRLLPDQIPLDDGYQARIHQNVYAQDGIEICEDMQLNGLDAMEFIEDDKDFWEWWLIYKRHETNAQIKEYQADEPETCTAIVKNVEEVKSECINDPRLVIFFRV